MLSSQSLNRCIDLLAQINMTGSSAIRTMALEIGYILKQELDVVISIEQASANRNLNNRLDPNLILQDNIQLINENQKLLKENMELQEMLGSRVNVIASKLGELKDSVSYLNNTISNMR